MSLFNFFPLVFFFVVVPSEDYPQEKENIQWTYLGTILRLEHCGLNFVTIHSCSESQNSLPQCALAHDLNGRLFVSLCVRMNLFYGRYLAHRQSLAHRRCRPRPHLRLAQFRRHGQARKDVHGARLSSADSFLSSLESFRSAHIVGPHPRTVQKPKNSEEPEFEVGSGSPRFRARKGHVTSRQLLHRGGRSSEICEDLAGAMSEVLWRSRTLGRSKSGC